MAGNLSIAVNEQICINILRADPDSILRFDRNYFISQLAKDLFIAIKECFLAGMKLDINSIVIHGNKINDQITKDLILKLDTIDFDATQFEKHFKILKQDYAKHLIETEILKETLIQTSKKGEINTDKLLSLRDTITESLEMIEGKESSLISTEEMFDKYHEILLRRKKGELLYETGDGELDKYLTMGFAPGHMTTFMADSGVGKSVVVLNIANKQINKQIPCIYITLENNLELTMDRLVSMRLGIDADDLYFKKEIHNEHVFDLFIEEKERIKNLNTFWMVDEPNLSLADIEVIIKEGKRKMKSDYVCVFLDLQSMVSDFTNSIDPQSIEQAVNVEHRLSKRQTCHFVNVLQTNGVVSDFKPKSVKECSNFRFSNIRNIKNASAFGERSRAVIGIYRPKQIAENIFGKEHPEIATQDDLIYLQCIKQNAGPLFTLKKLFVPERYQVFNIKKDSTNG